MDTPVLRIGDLLEGRYRIEQQIGAGGHGSIFRATQLPLGREVAIKVVTVVDAELLARFAREAEIAQRLEHPNTIRILDFGKTPSGSPYLALELLRGQTLHELLCAQGGQSARAALTIIEQVLKSLAEAHQKGVVHRDIKPENVFISAQVGEPLFVKVLDFGIAKQMSDKPGLTAVGDAIGTPSYMAPEQVMGMPVDARTDIYAVGLLLAEIVTGRTVFEAGGNMTIMRAQLSREEVALSPQVKSSVVGPIVERAVRKWPQDRYQSALEMIEAVRQAQRSLDRAGPTAASIPVPQPSVPQPSGSRASGSQPSGSQPSATRQAVPHATSATAPAALATMQSAGAATNTAHAAGLQFAPTQSVAQSFAAQPSVQPYTQQLATPQPTSAQPAPTAASSRKLPAWLYALGGALFAGIIALAVLAFSSDGRRKSSVAESESESESESDEAPRKTSTRKPQTTSAEPVQTARSKPTKGKGRAASVLLHPQAKVPKTVVLDEVVKLYKQNGYTILNQAPTAAVDVVNWQKGQCPGYVSIYRTNDAQAAETIVNSLANNQELVLFQEGLAVLFVGSSQVECRAAAAKVLER